MSANLYAFLCVLVAVIGFIAGIILMKLLSVLRRRDADGENTTAVKTAAKPAALPAAQTVVQPVIVPAAERHITRREIAEHIRKSNDTDVSVAERPSEPHLPMTLKLKGKTYAMLYGTEDGIVMVVKLPAVYASNLMSVHQSARRAIFPKGSGWYYVPVDKTFKDKEREQVYAILGASRYFVAGRG